MQSKILVGFTKERNQCSQNIWWVGVTITELTVSHHRELNMKWRDQCGPLKMPKRISNFRFSVQVNEAHSHSNNLNVDGILFIGHFKYHVTRFMLHLSWVFFVQWQNW